MLHLQAMIFLLKKNALSPQGVGLRTSALQQELSKVPATNVETTFKVIKGVA